jgi:alkylated DNA repair dioxygenase AlkB
MKWSFDCFRLTSGDLSYTLPKVLQDAYDELRLPFCILPGCLVKDAIIPHLSVATLTSEVDFRVDEIRTTASVKVVQERRQTAWQGDKGVGPFCYSGKRMPRSDWSPTVELIRDRLQQATGQYYDGCLLNLYPDGRSGMRYHIDPDQGTLWDYDTAVVSVGASRRFAFRPIPSHEGSRGQQEQPHNFVVTHGDVTYMFGDCQERFQHTVKNADNKTEVTPRVSLVFKRSWSGQK